MPSFAQNIENIEGPFFNAIKAAEYCGYAPETFRDYMQQYKIPRYGPKRTRFARTTLDEFMAYPEKFLPSIRKHKAERVMGPADLEDLTI